jgi:ubiquinone/menaquinone biosynthesis C-methylase UbiE
VHEFELREQQDEDAIAATYDERYHDFPLTEYWDDDFFSFVQQAFTPGDRVLDLGCGPASLWDNWRQLDNPDRLVGVDLSAGMIDQARRRFPEGEFLQARLHDLPFGAGSFDLVIASSVLHHVPDEHMAAALQEVARVLDEHGRVVGREPSADHLFGKTPPWTSAAVMNFRHLVFRLTHSREEPEPVELGEHHRILEPANFLAVFPPNLRPTKLEHRFAFSSYVLRVRSERVAAIARRLDHLAQDRPGAMFYFVADKNYATAADVAQCVEQARTEAANGVSDIEFLAYLQAAAQYLEQTYSSHE